MNEINLDADIKQLNNLMLFIESNINLDICNDKCLVQVKIACEEIFSNIAKYAFPDRKGSVCIKVIESTNNREVIIKFIDSGIPFDPIKKGVHGISNLAENDKVGGLGILIAKKLFDSLDYEYKNNQNILTCRKYLI